MLIDKPITKAQIKILEDQIDRYNMIKKIKHIAIISEE